VWLTRHSPTIAETTFRLEGDRVCGNWSQCDRVENFCWRFRLQGHNELPDGGVRFSEGVMTVVYKPIEVQPPQPDQPETNSGLSVLSPELHDAADIFAQGVADAALRLKAVAAVNNLADQLLAGNVKESRDALYQARVLLTNLDATSSIDVAPVVLALNYIERRMTEILDPGAWHG